MQIEYTKNAVAFTWSLCGPGGAAFVLYPNENQGKAEIKKAINDLRNSRDVVSLRIADKNDRFELYRAAIFCDELTRHLKYYEFDEPAIKKAYRENLTPREAVEKYILPNSKNLNNENHKPENKNLLH